MTSSRKPQVTGNKRPKQSPPSPLQIPQRKRDNSADLFIEQRKADLVAFVAEQESELKEASAPSSGSSMAATLTAVVPVNVAASSVVPISSNQELVASAVGNIITLSGEDDLEANSHGTPTTLRTTPDERKNSFKPFADYAKSKQKLSNKTEDRRREKRQQKVDLVARAAGPPHTPNNHKEETIATGKLEVQNALQSL